MDEGTRGELLDRLAGAIESESVTTSHPLRVAVEAFEQTLDRARIRDLARLGSTAEVERRFRTRYTPPSSSISPPPARPITPTSSSTTTSPGAPPGKSDHTVVRRGIFG